MKPPPLARVCHLVGPARFELATSTMSRPIGRTKTRVDSSKLAVSAYGINRWIGTNPVDGALLSCPYENNRRLKNLPSHFLITFYKGVAQRSR